MKTIMRAGMLLILLGILQFVLQSLNSQSSGLFRDLKRYV